MSLVQHVRMNCFLFPFMERSFTSKYTLTLTHRENFSAMPAVPLLFAKTYLRDEHFNFFSRNSYFDWTLRFARWKVKMEL